MKIIFDSVDEMEEVKEKMKYGICPYELGVNVKYANCKGKDCLKCWEEHVEMEVRE